MSNDVSSSSRDPSAPRNVNISETTAEQDASPPIDDDDSVRAKLRAQQGRRAFFLDDLIRSIDIAIYCQLSVLYYMEYAYLTLFSFLRLTPVSVITAYRDPSCSLLRFFLRAIPHWLFFTPKPSFFPAPPSHRPYVSIILVTNLFALALHIFLAAPEAGESMRWYLHGGLLIDFVGELGPISKFKLFLLDTLTMALQFIMLPAVLERRELKAVMEGSSTGGTNRSSTGLGTMQVRQDIDAEEQGIHRGSLITEEDIELQPLQKDTEHDTILNSSSPRTEHHLDNFYSGQLVIADLHILDTIRMSWTWRYSAVG